jgi:hypothetical protein
MQAWSRWQPGRCQSGRAGKQCCGAAVAGRVLCEGCTGAVPCRGAHPGVVCLQERGGGAAAAPAAQPGGQPEPLEVPKGLPPAVHQRCSSSAGVYSGSVLRGGRLLCWPPHEIERTAASRACSSVNLNPLVQVLHCGPRCVIALVVPHQFVTELPVLSATNAIDYLFPTARCLCFLAACRAFFRGRLALLAALLPCWQLLPQLLYLLWSAVDGDDLVLPEWPAPGRSSSNRAVMPPAWHLCLLTARIQHEARCHLPVQNSATAKRDQPCAQAGAILALQPKAAQQARVPCRARPGRPRLTCCRGCTCRPPSRAARAR